MIASPPYCNARDPAHAAWQARVRRYFEERAQNAATESDGACGGTFPVRAHTRAGPSGRPVQVAAHERTVTCD